MFSSNDMSEAEFELKFQQLFDLIRYSADPRREETLQELLEQKRNLKRKATTKRQEVLKAATIIALNSSTAVELLVALNILWRGWKMGCQSSSLTRVFALTILEFTF